MTMDPKPKYQLLDELADLEEVIDRLAEWTAADEEYDRRRDEALDDRRREREA